jgi:two-component system response regulator YesN
MIKVLMVDDERLIIQGFLHSVDWESYGYEIIGTAESSKSALKICEKNLPDIAILDINMSGMNGLELGGKLKTLNPDIVIIILTAYNEFDFAREAVRLQFDEYLLKPEIDFEDILETMERFSPKILKKRKNQMIKTSSFVWKLLPHTYLKLDFPAHQ